MLERTKFCAVSVFLFTFTLLVGCNAPQPGLYIELDAPGTYIGDATVDNKPVDLQKVVGRNETVVVDKIRPEDHGLIDYGSLEWGSRVKVALKIFDNRTGKFLERQEIQVRRLQRGNIIWEYNSTIGPRTWVIHSAGWQGQEVFYSGNETYDGSYESYYSNYSGYGDRYPCPSEFHTRLHFAVGGDRTSRGW